MQYSGIHRRLLETYQSFKSNDPIRSGQTYALPQQSFNIPSISPVIESKYICVNYELQVRLFNPEA